MVLLRPGDRVNLYGYGDGTVTQPQGKHDRDVLVKVDAIGAPVMAPVAALQVVK